MLHSTHLVWIAIPLGDVRHNAGVASGEVFHATVHHIGSAEQPMQIILFPTQPYGLFLQCRCHPSRGWCGLVAQSCVVMIS
jgi:hypothetical protein